ncbi:hypothetical protein [Marinobacter sp. CHS3-4]|uniref:hypothetical protein n=1 Tax=Marinobacter sp. CHS3-4 TaxID=3045174 RepID=UPI0024B5096B|nr:hypothetical protein [Marinobacter sp. CHS3-4]MDI9246719.1 hypothetical protein [Marinobacter sp. CHS3-4]
MNQLPDRATDARFGRRHLAIAYGSRVAALAYLFIVFFPAMLLTGLVLAGVLPRVILFALVPFSMLLPIALRLKSFHQGGPGLIPALGMNVFFVNAAMLLIVVGLSIG